jgi:hypothetical protein
MPHTYINMHAHVQSVGVQTSTFLSAKNKAPVVKPWNNAEKYPALYGRTELHGVTFAKFGAPCKTGRRDGMSDYAIGVNPTSADANHPMYVRGVEMVDVNEGNVAKFALPNPEWINQVMHVCI